MKTVMLLAVGLLALSALAESERSSDRAPRRAGQAEAVRRRSNVSQRGRRKNIWSYNPGHRSLAFLVAGEVVVVSPPPVESVTGAEYRCLGCCGVKASVIDKVTTSPELSNRVGETGSFPVGFKVIGTEPNSINDRCLGCCEAQMTPGSPMTTVRSGTTTTAPGKEVKAPVMGRQQTWHTIAPGIEVKEPPMVRQRTWQTIAPGREVKAPSKARQRTWHTIAPGIAVKAPPMGRQRTWQTIAPGREVKAPPMSRQRTWQAQRGAASEKSCVPPRCDPSWRQESSSSSEEISAVRRQHSHHRMQPVRTRTGPRCRHLGCRTALGSKVDDSSSSEED